MDELIYRFLLQSGFPRAAIVSDLGLLPLAGSDGADGDGNGARRPTYAIVDPETGDRLALVDVVDAVDGDGLRAAAGSLARYGQRFGGRAVQGFTVRVDPAGATADEQVQFYRVWPTETLERVSAKAFPDLDSMRTWQLLAQRRELSAPGRTPAASDPAVAAARAAAFGDAADDGARAAGDDAEPAAHARSAWRWLPGLVLAALAIADVAALRLAGDGLLNGVQALLMVGAAALLLVPALAHRR